jgi:hypothetical protein
MLIDGLLIDIQKMTMTVLLPSCGKFVDVM